MKRYAIQKVQEHYYDHIVKFELAEKVYCVMMGIKESDWDMRYILETLERMGYVWDGKFWIKKANS